MLLPIAGLPACLSSWVQEATPVGRGRASYNQWYLYCFISRLKSNHMLFISLMFIIEWAQITYANVRTHKTRPRGGQNQILLPSHRRPLGQGIQASLGGQGPSYAWWPIGQPLPTGPVTLGRLYCKTVASYRIPIHSCHHLYFHMLIIQVNCLFIAWIVSCHQ